MFDDSENIPVELLDCLPLAVAYIDSNLAYRHVNRVFESWFALPGERLVGRSLGAADAPTDLRVLRHRLEAAFTGETVRFEAELQTADGRRLTRITCTPRSAPDGRAAGAYLLIEKLTARTDTDAAIREALEGLGDGYLMIDDEWRISGINAAAEVFYGKSRDEMLGRTIEELWPGSLNSVTANLIREVKATNLARRRELPSAGRPDRTFIVDILPLNRGIIGVLQDTTERRAIERALVESEARFRNVAAALPGLLFLTDAEGRHTYVNDGYCRYTGLPEANLLGMGWIDALHPEDRARASSFWERLQHDPLPADDEFRFRREDGEHRWFLYHTVPQCDELGRATQWIGTALDIHDRKLAEEGLAAKRELLQSVIETSPDPIFSKNLDGTYRIANQATAHAIGAESLNLIGHHDREFLPPNVLERIENADARALAGETIVVEETIENAGLTPRTYLTTKAPLRGPNGEVIGLVGTARDITERKDNERQRELLVGELNHRVKNTLAIVQSIAWQTLRSGADPEEARHAFDARLQTLAGAHDILTRNNWEVFGLRQLLDRVLEPFRRADDGFDLEGPDVQLDARVAVGLALAFHELSTNAGKYGALSTPAGHVSIRWQVVRTDEGSRLRLTWQERGGPEVKPPERRGFGSRLIERGLSTELRGRPEIEFRPDGVVCEIEIPLLDPAQP